MTNALSLSDRRLEEIAERWPAAVALFDSYGLDLCCGGALRLSEAAERHGIPIETLLEELVGVVESAEAAAGTQRG